MFDLLITFLLAILIIIMILGTALIFNVIVQLGATISLYAYMVQSSVPNFFIALKTIIHYLTLKLKKLWQKIRNFFSSEEDSQYFLSPIQLKDMADQLECLIVEG